MKSLFELYGKNRFEQNKKMTISIYGVRTSITNNDEAEFLVYLDNRWIWMNAKCYTPIANKHS